MRGEFIGVWSDTWHWQEIWLPLIHHEDVPEDIFCELYREFASAHGGTPVNALRAVDMRNMVAMSILLAGFTPYLSSALNSDAVYRRG